MKNRHNHLLHISWANVLSWFCWSADVETLEELKRILLQMPREIVIKIDRLGEKLMGEAAFDLVIEMGFKLFIDAKITEIPTKIAALAKAYVERNPDAYMLNVMCDSWSSEEFELTGKMKPEDLDGIKQFADVCLAAGVRPCGVTVLTTTTEEVCLKKYGRTPIEQTMLYAGILYECGFRDMVCIVEAIPFVLAEFPDMNCWPAGIRPTDSAKDDQVNAKTPSRALEVGAHKLVIGRPFTRGNIRDNINRIAGQVVDDAVDAQAAA